MAEIIKAISEEIVCNFVIYPAISVYHNVSKSSHLSDLFCHFLGQDVSFSQILYDAIIVFRHL